jgi:MFS family permease
VTLLALPLTGVLVLHASAAQMGILTALGLVPYPLLALFAGVWADRRHRRATLVVADLGRAALLAVVPIGDAFGWLRIEELYVIAFLVGTLTVYFDVAFTSYVPDLVAEESSSARTVR